MDGQEDACAVSRDDLAAYLGIDYADAMVERNLDLARRAADGYLRGALGDGVDLDDPRAQAVGLAVAADVYDSRAYEREGSAKVSGAVRRLVHDLSEQLRCEARTKAEVGA